MRLRAVNILNKLRRLLPAKVAEVDYKIGDVLLRLPSCHQLPVYQHHHLNYDRFLPHLANYLPSEAVVIDVGANCGDTLAAMASANNRLDFLCIEADSAFFSYLLDNISRIQLALGPIAVKVVNAFVGRDLTDIMLVGSGGTKRAVLADSSEECAIKTQTLDSIVEIAKVAREKVILLKTDTDGFDYDVINSAKMLISQAKPIIFFECQPDSKHQASQYLVLIDDLANAEYCDWSLFDNFGALILRTRDENQVKHMINYLWTQADKRSTRTFYYIDVLASTTKNAHMLDECLIDY